VKPETDSKNASTKFLDAPLIKYGSAPNKETASQPIATIAKPSLANIAPFGLIMERRAPAAAAAAGLITSAFQSGPPKIRETASAGSIAAASIRRTSPTVLKISL